MLKSFLKKLSKRNKRRPSRSSAMNFVTGDKGLGSSVVSVAKNNVSRFNRVENAVPQQSLVSQLIPNISNPIERKGSKEDTNFISEYLDFFGSKKTAKTFKENLTFIKKSLTNTFEIAKILRVAIKNIVDQLKGLQGADGGGGIFGNLLKTLFSGLSSLIGGLVGTIVTAILGKLGLKNLAKIFKKTAPDAAKGALKSNKLFSRMGKFGKFGLIAGGLGLGGLAISNLLGDENMSKFTNILGKFERAIDSLMGKKQPGDGDGGGGGGGSGGGGGGDVNAADVLADTPEEKAFIATVRELEGTAGPKGYSTFFGGSQYGGDLTKLTVNEVAALQKKFLAEGKGRFFDKKAGKYRQSAAVGAGQFLYPEEIARKMGMDPAKVKFDEAFQNAAILYLARVKRGVDPGKQLTKRDFNILQKEWAGFGRYYGQTSRTIGQTTEVYLKNLTEAGASVSPVVPKRQVTKRESDKPSVTVVPMPAPKPAVEQSASPIISPQSDPGGGAPTATFLSSSNPDSGHTQLSTRSTLNITE